MLAGGHSRFFLKKKTELYKGVQFFLQLPLTKKNTYDKISRMCVEGRVNMEDLFVTSTKYAKLQKKGTSISISKNKYNFYIKSGFIII